MKNKLKVFDVINVGGVNLWIIISCILGVIGSFQVYPFIGLADGFSRWNLAMEIISNGSIKSDTLLSPIIPYMQAFTYKLTNSFGLYTAIQAALFYMGIGFLIQIMIGELYFFVFRIRIYIWLLVSILVTAIPTVYIFPLMLTDSASIFALIVFIGRIILSNIKLRYKAILLFILSFLCVSIRINSLIMSSLIILLFFIKAVKLKNIKIHLLWGMVFMGCLFGVFSMKILVPKNYNAATLGMIWELVGEASTSNDKQLIEKLALYGNIEEGIKRYGEPYLNSIVWDNNPPFPAMRIAGQYSKQITALYFNEAIKHPLKFIVNKWHYVERSLGISEKLISSRRGVHNVDNLTKLHGALDTYLQRQLRNIFFQATDSLAIITLRPFFAFLITSTLIIVMYLLGEKNRSYLLFIYLAAGYYSSFLLNTQAFEFRYYAPTLYIFLCLIICSVIKIIYLLFTNMLTNNLDLPKL